MEDLINILKYVELGALICCLLVYCRNPNTLYRFLLLILLVINFTEWGLGYLQEHHVKVRFNKKMIGYNTFVPLQLTLWGIFIAKQLQNTKWISLLKLISSIYFLLSVVFAILIFNGIKFGNIGTFFTPSYAAGVIILSIACLRYLYEFGKSDLIMGKWANTILPMVIMLLVFYLGTLPFHTMRSYLYYNYLRIFNGYYYLFLIFNYLLYITIAINALTLYKPKK